MTTATIDDKQKAINELIDALNDRKNKGTYREIHFLKITSKSGITHKLKFFIVVHGTLINATKAIATALNEKLDKEEYITRSGGQFNHQDDIATKLQSVLYNDGTVIKCWTIANI